MTTEGLEKNVEDGALAAPYYEEGVTVRTRRVETPPLHAAYRLGDEAAKRSVVVIANTGLPADPTAV